MELKSSRKIIHKIIIIIEENELIYLLCSISANKKKRLKQI